MLRAQVLEQAARARAPAEQLDGTLQFLSFSVARVHIWQYDFRSDSLLLGKCNAQSNQACTSVVGCERQSTNLNLHSVATRR
jgi:hypothetical protein